MTDDKQILAVLDDLRMVMATTRETNPLLVIDRYTEERSWAKCKSTGYVSCLSGCSVCNKVLPK